MLSTILLALSLYGTHTLASPIAAATAAVPENHVDVNANATRPSNGGNEADIQPWISLIMYADESCNDIVPNNPWTVTELHPGVKCYRVNQPMRSIEARGWGSKITTWSGSDCRGSSEKISKPGDCYSLPYGSVSVVRTV
ncbi:hypothetical protein F5X99DRAFT_423935 [Biscogniauxia marginata]|nr:hypothetical protein F5X99DRAFT_423935 [Biscogniauxia marginata]